MLNVIDNYLECKYINSYWLNNEIIDQNKKKEKLNNKYEIIIDCNSNDFKEKYNNIGDRDIDKSNIKRKYIKNNNREGYRKQDSNNRMYDKEKSCEHRIFQECPNTNKNKGKMYDLPEKCRVYEYRSGERKILLDSFSIAKLR